MRDIFFRILHVVVVPEVELWLGSIVDNVKYWL
jgi:hypothetical protein